MGIFSRLSDIMNSNLNALLDRAENPRKLIRLVIQEMEDTLVEVRSGAVRMIADRRETERRLKALQRDAADWQRRAEFAVERGREDMAKAALLAKARVGQAIAEAEAQNAAITEAIAKQNEDVGALQAKLDEAKSREKAILVRHQSAAARLKARGNLYDQRITDAFARFEQVERNLDIMEGKVEAYDLGRRPTQGMAPGITDEFASLEADAGVERELEALKSRLGKDKAA